MQVRKRTQMRSGAIRTSNSSNYKSINMNDTEEETIAAIASTTTSYSGTPMNTMSPTTTDSTVKFVDRLARLQNTAIVMSHFFAFISMCLVISWIKKLGGLSWSDGAARQVFNWHPFLMVTAFCFMTVAALAFRLRCGSRPLRKLVHGLSWSVALICVIVALAAVFKSHNDAVSGFIANMYSLHSWIGISLFILYSLQFLFGAYAFAWPGMSPESKSKVLLLHKYMGPFVYNMMAFTMLLGIQEKEGFIGCSYAVDKVDRFPIANFGKIPSICKVSHTLGIFILFMALSTSFALYDFGTKKAATTSAVTASEHHIL